MEYPASLERDGKFLIADFPDCPGCQTFVRAGGNIDAEAKDALSGWLEANLGRNLIPPKPSRRSGSEFIHVSVDPLLAIRLELRWARADAELTQAQLAKKLRMSQQQLARLESGESNPTVKTIARVASGLGRRVVMKLEEKSDLNGATHTRRRLHGSNQARNESRETTRREIRNAHRSRDLKEKIAKGR